MARGPKKHLKRLNAPKHWMLDKLGGVFAPKPSPGACAMARERETPDGTMGDAARRALDVAFS